MFVRYTYPLRVITLRLTPVQGKHQFWYLGPTCAVSKRKRRVATMVLIVDVVESISPLSGPLTTQSLPQNSNTDALSKRVFLNYVMATATGTVVIHYCLISLLIPNNYKGLRL